MERRNFTKTWIASLPFEPIEYQDSDVPQLRLRVGKRKKSFCVVRFARGKFVRYPIGDATTMNPLVARDEARKIVGLIGSGHDPRITRVTKRDDLTLEKAWVDYQTAKKLKPTTKRNYRQLYDAVFENWQHLPLDQISWPAVRDRYREIGANHPAYANAAMRWLRLIFNFAKVEYTDEKGQPLITENPVDKLKQQRAWYKVKRRQTLLRKQDLKPWFEAVCKLADEVHRDYLLVLLFTGMRRTEPVLMRPAHVDLPDRSFILPDTKGGFHRLPMGAFLYKVMERRIETGDDWLFPGRHGGPLHSAQDSIEAVERATGLEFTLHDLRRTFTTVAESLDISPYAIKRLLNHELPEADVTGGYIVPNIERLREPMQRIEDELLRHIRAAARPATAPSATSP